MNRAVAAARLHLINPRVSLGMPWLVVGVSFAITWVVWRLADIHERTSGDSITGGVLALYITVMVGFIQAVTQLLPFAMGISVSRRTFYLGAALVAGASALLYGFALAVLVEIQRATGGWGVGLDFWAPGGVDVDGFGLQVLVSGAPLLAFAAIGLAMGVTYKRWGTLGVWGLIIGGTLLVGLLVVLATWLDAWGSVGAWFADQSVVTLAVGLPVVIALVTAALTWIGLRRVVP